jgi:hydrogenase nickel incorporation protein HypA/HybF
MHELSIAVSMIELAEEEAQRRGGVRVTAIHLKLGPLSGVAKAALEACYELACAGTTLEGSTLVIEEMPVVVNCPNCDARRTTDSAHWFTCPVCGASAEVVQGRELEVAALEIGDPDPAEVAQR